MTTDDPAAIRAVLREHGIEVPDRGRISAEHMAAYEDIKAGQAGTGWDGADEPGEDDADEPGHPPPGDEKPPKRPKGAGAKATARTWLGKQRSSGKKGRGRPSAGRVQHPRVKVDDLIATGWGLLGRLSQPVSVPVSRTFALQAPVAGLVLDEAVRGTLVDRVLQPLARGQERAQAVMALAGPPLIVAAMERAQGLEEPLRSIRLEVLGTALEECMLMWQEVAGDKFAEAEQRMRERESARAGVRDLIRNVIFAGPPVCGKLIGHLPDRTEVRCARPPHDDDSPCAASEDQAAAYAQQMAGV